MSFIPHTEDEVRRMLERIGAASVDELFSDIPAQARLGGPLNLPPPMTEGEVMAHMHELGLHNSPPSGGCFLGAGAYRHHIPAAVDALASRSEFYTAYTPYQPEVSQGTLTAIFEFQSLMCALLGMDVANASLYDGASAAAEAALLACNHTGRKKVLVSRALHPEYRAVLRTYLTLGKGIELVEVPLDGGATDLAFVRAHGGKDTAALLVQNPNFFGVVEDGPAVKEALADSGSLLVVVVNELLSLGVLANPGSYGADAVAGEGQSLGIPLGAGGPYLGFLAVKDRYLRKLPGRLVGETKDHDGRRAFCLTLQAREQHIRREGALSNICTNEALCALMATIYLSLAGPQGLREVSRHCFEKAHVMAERIFSVEGFAPLFAGPFFHEVAVATPVPAGELAAFLDERGIAGGFLLREAYPDLDEAMLFCATEATTEAHIEGLVDALKSLRVPSAQGGAR